jgi:LacI family transcriptional regulator, galactose operon repressor
MSEEDLTTLAKGDGAAVRAPTMRDVAALAGVSIKTVSRVVNQEPGVSPELAARVLDAVALLGYRHNLTASSLRRADQKTATIGLLLDDSSNPFSSELLRAIEDVAWERGTLALAGSSDEDPDRQRELLHALVSRRVDGLIAVPASGNQSSLLHERLLGRPLVLVDRPAPEADSVTVDNRAGAARALRHLVAHGHRRVAFLGDLRSLWTATERHAGYVEGLAAEDITLDPHLVVMDVRGVDAAERAVSALLSSAEPPTALLTGQNLITIGAIHALQRLGLQHRVALVGFDDFPLADLLDPRVSVVAQDPTVIGRTAAELLFARLDGGRRPPQHVVVPTRLIARDSGELRPDAPAR